MLTMETAAIASFFVLSLLVLSDGAPQVETPSGTVEGIVDKTVNGKEFLSFQGIPYARPPVGKHRFKDPVPPKPWKGIWKANTTYACMQYGFFVKDESDPVEGTEDCLYVNVYTPKIQAKLNVIVFIHGGGFIFGASTVYQPHILLDHDVVLVTFNYRLGPLGFLSTEDDVVPGNTGLKDQILALKWIKNNIQYFGGNPNSITITGLSAGGVSVHFHTLTSGSQNLFHRAIATSGCILQPWAMMDNPLERTQELALLVGCEIEDSRIMVECLRSRPAKQIVSTVGNFLSWRFNPFSPFGFVVDGDWATNPVIPKHPLQLLKQKAVKDLPLIFSHTTGEGLYNAYDYYPTEHLEYIDEHWNEVLPHILHYNHTVAKSVQNDVSQKIRLEYFGDQHLRQQTFDKLVDLMGDRLFKVDLDKCARLHASTMKSPLWYYVFNYRGAHSSSEIKSGVNAFIGVPHGDDTSYVLKTPHDTLSTKEDRAMTELMTKIFVSFSKNGEPDVNATWEPIPKKPLQPLNYLKINSPTSLVGEKADEFGRKSFWVTLPIKENEKLFKQKDEL